MIKPKYILLALAVIAAAFLAGPVSRYVRYHYGYEQLRPGMSEKQVLDLFGKPSRVEVPKDTTPAWDQVRMDTAKYSPAVAEWTYYSPVLTPEGWLIGFDKNGKVVKRVNLVSY